MRRLMTVMLATFVGLALAGSAIAQGYPTHPVTMIVPFPAGGATDTLARFLAERIRATLGQPVVIEAGGERRPVGILSEAHAMRRYAEESERWRRNAVGDI